MLTKAIAASSSGVNQIVAGVAGFKYRVLAWLLSFSGTVNAKWQTGNAVADLTGLVYGVANTLATSPVIPVPTKMVTPPEQFETNPGDDLSLNLSGGVAVGGYVVYEKVAVGAST
jgi:hypothetical protein